MNTNRVNIIGVPISAVNMNACLSNIFEDFNSIRGKYICVSNVHTTVMAHDDSDYLKVQTNSFMSLPDGKPLSVVGRKQFPQMDRVTGPDLMRRIFEESKTRELRHYFYGNVEENLEKLVVILKEEYPWIKVAGYEPSVFRPLSAEEEKSLCERINESKADFIWIGLGAPKQEKFCYELKDKVNGLMIGVGGAFNVLAGIVPEAPLWMQKMSLEWLYRLIQEPKRLFKRYAVTNTKFIYYLLRERI